jgi:hypothetical protein
MGDASRLAGNAGGRDHGVTNRPDNYGMLSAINQQPAELGGFTTSAPVDRRACGPMGTRLGEKRDG